MLLGLRSLTTVLSRAMASEQKGDTAHSDSEQQCTDRTVLVGCIGGSGLYHLDNPTFVYVTFFERLRAVLSSSGIIQDANAWTDDAGDPSRSRLYV